LISQYENGKKILLFFIHDGCTVGIFFDFFLDQQFFFWFSGNATSGVAA